MMPENARNRNQEDAIATVFLTLDRRRETCYIVAFAMGEIRQALRRRKSNY
jgi:hypothetical protein